jgi:hypothetical protein
MHLEHAEFFNGANRSRELLAKGNVMFINPRPKRVIRHGGKLYLQGLGDDTTLTPVDTTSPVTFDTGSAAPYVAPAPTGAAAPAPWASLFSSMFNAAVPAINQATGTTLVAAPMPGTVVAKPPMSSTAKLMLIGGAGVLALMMFKGARR